ncbi:hypothetical protein [Peribacillus muralis]|uniref:hypothetical protein n=1 Tax=Peribacillus muralis TaxID=264697 RepID=UPI003D039961
MTKRKNPVIQEAREEGIKVGMTIGQQQTFLFFFEYLEENLEKIPGIGPTRKQHVMDHFLKNFGHEKTQEK